MILALAGGYGIDFAHRTATLFDEGDTKVSTSTLPQVGCAVAALLSLPIKSEGPKKEACLENLRNKVVHINSFTLSQKDMLASALRVTGTTEEEWIVTKEPMRERFTGGMKELKEGKHSGFPKLMSRVFFPDGCGDFEHRKGTLNSLLGLPEEDIDGATRVAIERAW
ncbi:hypothetical protein MMC13_007041 [Lambiella insularis]|nr:hypothetical protein [Lambiella insularis]